jgi:hypothetical protein
MSQNDTNDNEPPEEKYPDETVYWEISEGCYKKRKLPGAG